jgi:uncharacterized protein (TIGR01777 family)
LLEVSDVGVRFGGVVALDGLSFTIEPGQVCALIGPNGAGKTTLFNVVSRLYQPTSGSVQFEGTDLLARTLAALDAPPSVMVSGSAIGIYGETGETTVDESSPLARDFLASVCTQWEAAAAPAIEAGIRVPFLRTGIVLTPDGGALAKLLPLFKLGVGGRMGSGRQWWSWISLTDELAVIRWLLDNEVSGPVNATAPEPVTNAQMTKTLGSVLHRPTLFPAPSFGPKLLLGGELAQALLFTSQRVLPKVLTDHQFNFSHPTLESALRAMLGRPAAA